ncbi:hypothetical protein F4774DRAFT_420144 [Daldinia eschscholtzii]|nr:hypothetical protein F4774DRAFT_420144 [Daldinia eschscholtzii]
MAVELRVNDKIIWESAGSNGAAIFELGEYQVDNSATRTVLDRKFTIVEASNTTARNAILHSEPIGAVFTSLISREPRIDSSFQTGIRRAICRLAHHLRKLDSMFHIERSQRFRPNLEAFRETANAFGFEDTLVNSIDSHLRVGTSGPEGLRALDPEDYEKLMETCGNHAHKPPDFPNSSVGLGEKSACLCTYVNRLITGFAVSIILLYQCRFNANQINVCEETLLEFGQTSAPTGMMSRYRDEESLKRIIQLVDANSDISSTGMPLSVDGCLGISGRSYTVCFTCILSHDCYDDQNRFLSLLPGRASLGGIYRPEILSNKSDFPQFASQSALSVTTSLAPGFVLVPHHVPSPFSISMDMALSEKGILVTLLVDYEEYHIAIPLGKCLKVVMEKMILRCPHDPKSELRVEKDHKLVTAGLGDCANYEEETEESKGVTVIIALHGNKLEQLLTMGILTARRKRFMFQRTACLSCCVKAAQNSSSRYVIMGG